ncbi:RNI-like protein [Phanerochaete sordida]|uniref:RNI-like protein n=1 Tax=Phanerochaete sordida TaxID=48140 RepID=A0A9P3G2L5_9APHY|nr:RNI-like protein [Phanerochaete sordida]
MQDRTASLPATGTRFALGGHLGTVRFVGPVEGTNGTWLGVEWDDPARGKHDGVKDNRRYFTCRVPNAGSFIRPTAVGISYGTSFLKALLSKYIEDPHGPGEKVILGSSKGAIEVEAVNLDKIRGKLSNLQRLREVSLDYHGVATADPPGDINRTCAGIRGLDLSKNLLPSWDTVSSIVSELPALETLALNGNRLVMPSLATPKLTEAFSGIKELQISSTLTTWSEACSLVNCMPLLRVLEMGYNLLEKLAVNDDAPRTGHPTLQAINFDGNSLKIWSDICTALSSFKSLQRLILSSNHLTTIDPCPDGQPPGIAQLKHLSLAANSLTDWGDLDRLYTWCPALESLTIAGNPLSSDPHLRQFAIAKIGSLATLDGAAISAKERTDCELFYLSSVAKHGPADAAARRAAHPRWDELCARHAFVDAPRAADAGGDTLGNRLFTVLVQRRAHAPGTGADATQDPAQALRVLPSMSMRTFRMKLAKTFKLGRAEQPGLRLWLKMPDGAWSELESAEDTHDLAWWGLEDGSEIVLVAGSG